MQNFVGGGDLPAAAHGLAENRPQWRTRRRSVAGGQRERETRTPIKGVRKLTAAAMVSSAFTAPHATEFLTVDVTPTMELLARLKAAGRLRASS